jgi:methyl-accepting chemotaxis protein
MNVIKKLIQTPFVLMQKAMSKLKVIQHIMLIIFVMSVFLVVQGLLALSTFNRMQANSQKVFKDSVNHFLAISTLKEELYHLQHQYLLNVSGGIQNTLSFNQIEHVNLDFGPSQNQRFQKEFSELKTLSQRPYTEERYRKFNEKLMFIMMDLKNVESDMSTVAVNSMAMWKELFKYSSIVNIGLLIFSLLVTFSLGVPMAKTISAPLKEMISVVNSLARGDFTRLITVRGNREVNQLVDGLNHAIRSLRNLVTNINEQAQILARAGKELSEASSESGKSASEVARAMESMSKSAVEQSGEVNATANNVTRLGQLVKKVANDAMSIAKSSEQVAYSARAGQKISTDVAAGIGGLYTTIKEASEIINDMSQSSEEINKISSLISGIAEQTTLLALNASIEAARAGEHGRGFSVVAQETGKLAEQSKQAAQIISDLIKEMIVRSRHAVTAMQKGVGEVGTNKTLTTEAATTFGNIFGQLEQTLIQIHDVAKSAQQMEQHNERVTTAVNSVAVISEQGMATMEEVSATVEEQSASAEEVAALAGNLFGIAETMKKAVATFKV